MFTGTETALNTCFLNKWLNVLQWPVQEIRKKKKFSILNHKDITYEVKWQHMPKKNLKRVLA